MMSTEARASPSGGRDSVESLSPQPYPPHFYPAANYQGPPQPPWFPGQLPPGASGPWPAPPWAYPGLGQGWAPPATGGKISPQKSSAAVAADEYTVDTMRRIYNDDDGRVEIQRVKVQRRGPEPPSAAFPPGADSMSVVPYGAFPLNERRPPPRKNKMKRQMELMQSHQGQQGQHPWYPYMPCMPYPYPHPYYYGGGCMWPPGMPAPPISPWPGSDDSERTISRQESLPTTLDSQRLESRVSGPLRNSHSPVSQRSSSPAATTHSITPSDSVSVRGYKIAESLNSSFRGPTPPPRTKSRSSTERRARAIMAPSDASSEVGDKSSISTTCTDIVPYQKLPPRRKNRKSKIVSISDVSSSLDFKDTDSLSDRSSISSDLSTSQITCDDSKVNSELSYAFRKFEQSMDVFKSKVSVDSTPVNTPPPSPPPIILHSNNVEKASEDDRRINSLAEVNTAGEDTDTYIEKRDTLNDQQPSTTSFSSLPLLETAPLESMSSSTSAKLEDTSTSSNVPVVCESKSEEVLQNVSVVVVEANTDNLKSTSDAIANNTTMTDTTTKITDAQQSPVLVSLQDTSTTNTAVNVTVVSSTQDTLHETTAVPSQQVDDQKSQDVRKTNNISDKDHQPPIGKLEVSEAELEASSGRDSRLSSSTFFSIRPSDDPLHIDTDSTDILLPTTDATTADEGGEGTDWTASSPVVEDTESYQWVLQQPGEIPDLACSTADREDERRNAWRAEVSLWRARLVVSLCRGRGLDRQDWATFHLLVHHPLTLDLKLSMLHAPRLCVANSTVGAAMVRVALIHLAQYGETLLQSEASRQLGWRSIKIDPNQSWSPVKGAVEILKALGYQEREDGVLRFPRRSGTEVSVLARLTLDMLVLAEELRLYLTGTHQYPTNISDLFFPTAASTTSAVSDDPQILPDLPRPPSSSGSYSFMSAQSNTSLNLRPDSRASTVTDEDTKTLQVSVKQVKSSSKKAKQPSSSEEEVTLIEELVNRTSASQDVDRISTDVKRNDDEKSKSLTSDISPIDKDIKHLQERTQQNEPSLLGQSMASLDMSSMPDLQSIRSSTVSLLNSPMKEESNGLITPVPPTLPETDETKDNPEEHIYEEIDVIRQQVQALRSSSVPVDIQPPPLPPKKKVSSGGEDDSGLSLTYPHMEWTTSSMPGSLRGGSAGARRKKRRAPMPPDFMPLDWKPYENRPEDTFDLQQSKAGSKTKEEYRHSLNPFYEDIDSVKDQVKELNKDYENRRKNRSARSEKTLNPFGKEAYAVSGYVGKNPFYEDIDIDEEIDNHENISRSAAGTPKVGGSNVCAMGSLSELQDESVLIKSKRKAPKPPATPDPSNRPTSPHSIKGSSSPQPPRSPSSPQPPKSPSSPQPPKHPPNEPPPKPPSSPQPPKSPSSPQPPKSSSSPQPPKSPTSKSPSSPSPKDPPPSPPPRPPALQQQKSNYEQKGNTTKPTEISELKDQRQTADIDKGSEKDQNTDGAEDKTKASNTGSITIKSSQQKSQVQHPTIPPPPPPPNLRDEEDTLLIIPASNASQNPPPALFDDIPYMDSNYYATEKEKLAKLEIPQCPQYEIPELPGKDGIPLAPPLSPTTMRQTAMLLSGHRSVPFIDESDLPPDCPPPPPPTSPPKSPTDTPKGSPPDTPKGSPPETPHVSPPETPHTSPPETPCGSPSSSPITVKENEPKENEPTLSTDSPVNVCDKVISSNDMQIDKSSQEKESVKVTDSQLTLTPEEDESSKETNAAPSPTAETVVSTSKESEDTEAIQKPPPLPPKTVISQNSSNGTPSDTYANQSVRSEDRYEIPENPKPSTESVDDEGAIKLEPIEENMKNDQSKPQEESAEERYEIPEVVKETALSIGPQGMPVRVGGPSHLNRMDMESVFGPPKPPRRRRNNSLPPPRPPKSMILEGSAVPVLPPKSATTIRPASATTTSSFVTASTGSASVSGTPTSFRGTPKPMLVKQNSKSRRSWPLLFCDCMYVSEVDK